MPLIKYRTEKQEVSEIMVNSNITVSGFLDLVNKKSKEKVTKCIFRGKILDNDDLIRNHVTYPSYSLTLLTDSADNIQSDIVDFENEIQEKANKKELENKISSSLIKRTQSNQNRKGFNFTFTIYTTATLESMLHGTKKDFSLISSYYLVYDEIENLVSSFLHNASGNEFDLHIFLPGGVPFNSGIILDYYSNPEKIEYDYLYVLVIKKPKFADDINEEITEPCSCSDDKRKEILSPFCQSSINGLTQISAFLGYLYYGGYESEHILLSLAKITRFAPLVVNIYRLIEKRPLNILNILSITSPLFTLFRAMLPPNVEDENVFEYTLNFLTIFKSIKNSEYLKFIEFDSRNTKDCKKMRRFYRYCKKTEQQRHVIIWTADTINPDFESFFINPDFSTLENIFSTIKTFKPVSPLSLHYIFYPTFVRGSEDKSVILFLREISNKENSVLVIDPKEGHQKEINIETLAEEMNCKEKEEDFDALIEPNQVDQIIFICFDESKSQLASQFLKKLVKQSYALRVFSLYGLISFGSDVKTIQPLTAMTTQFVLNLNEITTSTTSDSAFLYDGIKKAQEQISNFCKGKEGNMKYPNSRSRIIVITSDGADNKSETLPETLINSLNEDEIVVDTISLNDRSSDSYTISRLTGGLCFNPHNYEEGIEIFEQEGFLNIKNRHMKALPYEHITKEIFEIEKKKNEEQEGDKKYDKFAPNQMIINAKTKVSLCTLEYMIYILSNEEKNQTYRKNRTLIELNIISKNDDDNYFVYPLHATSDEWRIFIRGPKGTSFENKWLELYMTMPIKYPKEPPRFRFINDVPFHPNVSKEGLVFYGLNNGDYKSNIGIDSMIIGIINLLSNPDENYVMNSKAMKLFKENIDEFKRQQAEGFTGVDNYEDYLSGVKIYNEIPKNAKLLKEEERNKTYIMSITRDAVKDVVLERGEIKDQNLLDIKDYEIIDKIGSGGFSVVYLVNDVKNDFEFAAKVSGHLRSDRLVDYIKEVNVISLLNHAAIVKIYGYCLKDFDNKNNQVIIMENVPNGDLQDVIDEEANEFPREGWDRTQKLITLYGIASGMAYSVSYGITHSDLKPLNILMTDDLFPKITDFDSARMEADSNRQIFNLSGDEMYSVIYSAPEVFLQSDNHLKNAEKSDVYSFAIIIYQIFTLKTPFEHLSDAMIVGKVAKGKRPKIPDSVPKQYCDLITQCWSQKPSQRPTFQQIVDRLKSDEFLSDKEIDKERFQDYVDYVKDYKYTLTKSKFIRPITEADKKKKKKEEEDENENEKIKQNVNVLILNLTDYIKETFLGKGRYGEVYKITQKDTGKVFAAKISFQKVSSKISQAILSEANIMKSLNHPSILKFIGYSPLNFEKEPEPTLIIEYSKNGSLQDFINDQKKYNQINDTQKLIIIFGIASGMSYLVDHSILHNDLKPSNVLLDENFNPKISDFGLSQRIARAENESNETVSIRGTPGYIAPEIWDNNKHNEASEVYSFGILLYEFAYMKNAFSGLKPLQISYKVQNGERPSFPFSIFRTNVYRSLIERCWSQKPEKRPTFKEIIKELQDIKYMTKNVNKEEYQRYIESIRIDGK